MSEEQHCEAGIHHASRGAHACQCGAVRVYGAVGRLRVEGGPPSASRPADLLTSAADDRRDRAEAERLLATSEVPWDETVPTALADLRQAIAGMPAVDAKSTAGPRFCVSLTTGSCAGCLRPDAFEHVSGCPETQSRPGCRFCGVAYTPSFVEYTMQVWSDERGEGFARFHVCSAEQCRARADKDVGDARMNVERRRRQRKASDMVERERASAPATAEHAKADEVVLRVIRENAPPWPNGPVAKAPTPEQMPLARALIEQARRAPSRPLMLDVDEPALRRSDGFDQRQVDAAKAVLLSSVPRKAGK